MDALRNSHAGGLVPQRRKTPLKAPTSMRPNFAGQKPIQYFQKRKNV